MKFISAFLLLIAGISAHAQDTLKYTSTEIIYGRKDGMALTMLQVTPRSNANGKAIIKVVSGNWVSSYKRAQRFAETSQVYLDAGYTVFAVMHGAQPMYAIDEQVSDLKRAVRFIRYNAKTYKIDPAHIGITGYSSGGHLTLNVALTDNTPVEDSKDPIDSVSARVQAVAVFFSPTDFLNWGQKGFNAAKSDLLLRQAGVAGAFDFRIWSDSVKLMIPVTPARRLELAKEVSPIYAVSSDDPPVFIVHGDKDLLVPLQQSQSLLQKLEEAKVPCQLLIKPGGGHGWVDATAEEKQCLAWFDKYLK
ncbi:alpha/beta hydrolase [Ferruginibacter sp. HRS2-29]|uniref:alpha/beta hydrolase n=1 Tax=Ferruginibacter sp. HRS2-29 TaxID=2487334 RepID=UPI0020CECE24|nr:alpha/beta hydrolase [Ferruginibacter sp. HRS2-29]MCP9750013.1 alpha/beta hydrolase [Ferruginibacter sp. HRS2-29]